MYYVYNLRCEDESVYTGCTQNLQDRMERHEKGRVKATQNRLPVTLICYTAFKGKYKAFEFEKYLKSGSGRSFLKRHFL